MEDMYVFHINPLVPLFRTSLFRVVLSFYISIYGSSHRRYSVKKCILKNFANFTGKHLCWSLFFIKLQALCWSLFSIKLQAFRLAILLKRDSKTRPATFSTQVFSCEICKILKNTYFEEHLRMATSKKSKALEVIRETVNHFIPLIPFYNPWKAGISISRDFPIFSGGIEREKRYKMDYCERFNL